MSIYHIGVLQLSWHGFQLCTTMLSSTSFLFRVCFLSAVVSATWSNLVAYLWHSLAIVLVDVVRSKSSQRAAKRGPKKYKQNKKEEEEKKRESLGGVTARLLQIDVRNKQVRQNSHLLFIQLRNVIRFVQISDDFFYGFHPRFEQHKNNEDTWEIPIDVSVVEHVGKHRFLILPQISRIHLMPCRYRGRWEVSVYTNAVVTCWPINVVAPFILSLWRDICVFFS